MDTLETEPRNRPLAPRRSFLDTIATTLVIVASCAVIALTSSMWRQQQSLPVPSQNAAAAVPSVPQSLDGAALLGDPGSRIAIIEYSDFQCPFCASFSQDTWPTIKKECVESGKVLAAFRHLPLEGHAFARDAAIAADCAGSQARFWQMHDALFAKQNELTAVTGSSLASALGLDAVAFGDCVRRYPSDKRDREIQSANALGVSATPTFLIGVVQADKRVRVTHVLVGAQPFARFKAVLDELLDSGQRFSWLGLWPR